MKRHSLLLAGAACCAALLLAQADARLVGGPGLRGGLSHPGTAMSIHAPGGGEFHGMRPGQGGSGERRPPGPGPGPGPHPPGPPGPGPHPGPGPGPGPGPHPPPPPVPYPYPVPVPDPWWDWDADPFWDGVAVADAVAVATVIGTTVYTLPSNCITISKNDLTYFECGNVWYQPHYLGSGVTYVVISPP